MTNNGTIDPVFVLGTARSGTTWLGNLIASHPAVVAAEHRAHWGQHEARIHLWQKWAGDLGNDRNLVHFIELFSSSDFFRLVEGDKSLLYQRRPATVTAVLFELMDAFARSHDARYWVTKLDPLLYPRTSRLNAFLGDADERYESPRFVAIRRDFRSVLRSYLHMEGLRSIHALPPLQKRAALLLGTARYVSHDRAVRRLVADRRGVVIEYTELEADPADISRRICDYLELDQHPLCSRFEPNSSFSGQAEKRELPDRWLAVAHRFVLPILRRLPALADWMMLARDGMRRNEAPFSWRLLRLELMPASLFEELDRTGQHALRAMLERSESDRFRS